MKDAKGHGSEPRGGGGTKLTPVAKIPNYAVIIRSIHERGGTQKDALAELDRRGLYLSSDQRVQANIGLVPRDAGATSVSGGQPVASNAHAAATLAGGPKSAPVDVHPSMATPHETAAKAAGWTLNPRYNKWQNPNSSAMYTNTPRWARNAMEDHDSSGHPLPRKGA